MSRRFVIVRIMIDARGWNRVRDVLAPDCFRDRFGADRLLLGKGGGINSAFLMFVIVAIIGLIVATRMIEIYAWKNSRADSVQLIVIRPLPIDKYPVRAMLMHAALFRCAPRKN